MDPIKLTDMALPNFNELCFIIMGFVIVFLAGFLVLGGAVELWDKWRK
jgi:hypothetical protein